MSCNFIQSQDIYCPVHWVDTDASEDEDFLPQFPQAKEEFPIVTSINYHTSSQQSNNSSFSSNSDSGMSDNNSESHADDFCITDETVFGNLVVEEDRKRGRINSMSWDTNITRRKKPTKTTKNDAPLDKVRKVINCVVDNGMEGVDLSNIGLEEIPDEIGELAYVTVLHNDIVKAASLQLFLYNNDIHTLNPVLFGLKNLTVLSLRFNRLESIPPDIALLENLIELSLGNNQLRYIPAELLRLKKLVTLSLVPNPFLPPETDKTPIISSPTTLKELAKRVLLNKCPDMLKIYSANIPQDIIKSFRSVSSANACEHCGLLFHTPDIETLVWRTIFNHPNIPVLYRFCSIGCSQSLLTTLN
ncbi:hypothetical protein BD560DRAFT_391510 [Blakeslea trispora]|nr:hypothetical protein BD560DRAFT_391510 [Blakeslea trispora]